MAVGVIFMTKEASDKFRQESKSYYMRAPHLIREFGKQQQQQQQQQKLVLSTQCATYNVYCSELDRYIKRKEKKNEILFI